MKILQSIITSMAVRETRPEEVGKQVASSLMALVDNLPPFSTSLGGRADQAEQLLGTTLRQLFPSRAIRVTVTEGPSIEKDNYMIDYVVVNSYLVLTIKTIFGETEAQDVFEHTWS